jgi:hypothetical protein
MSDSFRWYQAPLIVSLRNIEVGKLDSANCKLKEISKKTKTSTKTIHTQSKNSTLECGAQVQGGFKTFIQFIRNANKTTRNEKKIVEEKTSQNFGLDMLKGFQCRDLNVVKSSSWKYQFFNPPLRTKVLEDLKERFKYLGNGRCELVKPTFVGI